MGLDEGDVPHRATFHTLVKLALTEATLEDAVDILTLMREKRVRPEDRTYEALMEIMPPADAARVFSHQELTPPYHFLNAKLIRLTDGPVDVANEFLQAWFGDHMGMRPPSRRACSLLLRAACNAPEPFEAAQPILDVLRAHGLAHHLLEDVAANGLRQSSVLRSW